VPSIALLHDCCTLATQEDALRTWESASTQQSQHDFAIQVLCTKPRKPPPTRRVPESAFLATYYATRSKAWN